MQGALRVVFLSCGSAEGCHDRVAGELLDGSAGVGDLSRHCVVEPIEKGARSLGVLGAGELRGAYEVRKEDSCEFPLFARLSRFGDRRAAVGAESRSSRGREPAVRTERHTRIIRCSLGTAKFSGRNLSVRKPPVAIG